MKTIELNGLKLWQEVAFRYTYPGGYGKTVFVKGTVIKLNPKRCRIEGMAAKRNGEEYKKQVSIDYSNIKESTLYVAGFAPIPNNSQPVKAK